MDPDISDLIDSIVHGEIPLQCSSDHSQATDSAVFDPALLLKSLSSPTQSETQCSDQSESYKNPLTLCPPCHLVKTFFDETIVHLSATPISSNLKAIRLCDSTYLDKTFNFAVRDLLNIQKAHYQHDLKATVIKRTKGKRFRVALHSLQNRRTALKEILPFLNLLFKNNPEHLQSLITIFLYGSETSEPRLAL
jgi:hypothetical protein